MKSAETYKHQAQYWANYRFIDPTIKACVHLEDKSDTEFWDKVLQKYRPGKYHYISYSYSSKNQKTTGCEQCLRFMPYLSEYFFVCIDSDYRYLLEQKNLDAAHHVLQTYTYSWENHYCAVPDLQNRLNQSSAIEFDFQEFLSKYSKVVYEPLLFLINSRKNNDGELRDKDFNQCLISQCTAKELENNGEGAIAKIQANLCHLLQLHKQYVERLNINSLKAYYADKGLNESNAYLHVRGHNIFDLISNIGKMLSQKSRLDFVKTVLTSKLPDDKYWEMNKLAEDVCTLGK
jgi:hypothetical protein